MLRSAAWAQFWAVFRLLMALLGLAAIVAQLQRTVSNAVDATTPYGGHVPTVVANFLSFFTIQSNVASVFVLAIGAIWFWTRGRKDDAAEPRWFAVVLACVTTYMITTGIVYNLLLRGIALPQGQTVPWSNEVLHVVIPIVLLLDLLFAPRRRALLWRDVWIIVVYPIVWVIYTLIRGPLITAPGTGNAWWYPYPFLDPHNFDNGYATVALYIVGIAIGIVVVGFFVIWVGRDRVARHDRAGVSGAAA